MSTVTKRPLSIALAAADHFRELFDPRDYLEWHVAGSVRRNAPLIGDIEHVVIPRWEDKQIEGILFSSREPRNLVWDRLDGLLAAGRVEQHLYGNGAKRAPRWGEKYRGAEHAGVVHEIWLADQVNLGSILAIRTGPADFSHRLVTDLLRAGYMNRGGYVHDRNAWVCVCGWSGPAPAWAAGDKGDFVREVPGGGGKEAPVCPGCRQLNRPRPAVVECPTEEKYFELAGRTYLMPEQRR